MKTLQERRRHEGLHHLIGPYWSDPTGQTLTYVSGWGFRPATDGERLNAAQRIGERQQAQYPALALYCAGCEECR